MGCDGLRSQLTAEAFLEKGARAFVSWSQPVSSTHTDAATTHLLELLFIKDIETRQAVALTAKQVGPDPTYGAGVRELEAKKKGQKGSRQRSPPRGTPSRR